MASSSGRSARGNNARKSAGAKGTAAKGAASAKAAASANQAAVAANSPRSRTTSKTAASSAPAEARPAGSKKTAAELKNGAAATGNVANPHHTRAGTASEPTDGPRAADADRLWGSRLAGIKKKVMAWRREAMEKALELGDRWKDMQAASENGNGEAALPELPREHLIAFLASECQIPRRQVVRHIRMAETFTEEERGFLVDKGVEVNVALEIAAASPEVRAAAMKMIAEERCLDSRDLKALRHDMKRGEAVRNGELDKTRQSALLKAAAARGRHQAKAWLDDLKTFGEAFMAFAESDPSSRPDNEVTAELDGFAGEAAELRTRLAAIAGNDFLEKAATSSHPDFRFETSGWHKLDRALELIANRKVAHHLSDWPEGRDGLHVDFDLVWEIAWAFGYSRDNEPHQLRKRLRIEEQIPLEVDPSDEALQVNTPRKFTVLEICAGAGGQALGLDAAGFHHAGLVELDGDAAATMRVNKPDWPVIEGDLRELDLSCFAGVDLLAGGVPCQPFSTNGERLGRNDERDLFSQAVDLVRQIKPKAVMFENVTGLDLSNNTTYRLELLSRLHRLGYDAEWRTLDGVRLGLSQKRRRMVLVGFRPGIMHRFSWPMEIATPAPTLGEALRDLMAANGWKHVGAWVEMANDQCPTLIGGSQNKKGIDLAHKISRETWRTLGIDPNYHALTAPGPDAPPPSKEFRPRLTMEMIARLQDFPDGWAFQGTAMQRFRQIANAFPPRMARAMGLSIMRALTGAAIDLDRALATPVHDPKQGMFAKLNRVHRDHEEGEKAGFPGW